MATLELTKNHTGKMAGFMSLSTSPLKNPACMARCKNSSMVCSKCFSMRMQKRYTALERKLSRNSEILSGSILTADDFPVLNTATTTVKYFRLESFGDLINTTHAINYFSFCNLNPETRFTLWTKNPHFVHGAIKAGYSKPENLTIIYSSPHINIREVNDSIRHMYPFIDKIFTVFESIESANDCGQVINCGAHSCATCLKCYAKNNIVYINELLK